jgi:hypothetical protein
MPRRIAPAVPSRLQETDMTTRSALPTTDVADDVSDEDIAVLMPLLAQLQQARSDQREALIWLAQHCEDSA